jgi:hypothetical protein
MKRVIASLVALTTVGISIAIPLQAKALPFHKERAEFSEVFLGRHHEFEVLYRRHDRVRVAGVFRHYRDAENRRNELEREGYRAWIRDLS